LRSSDSRAAARRAAGTSTAPHQVDEMVITWRATILRQASFSLDWIWIRAWKISNGGPRTPLGGLISCAKRQVLFLGGVFRSLLLSYLQPNCSVRVQFWGCWHESTE
jgi:hypothetical protein